MFVFQIRRDVTDIHGKGNFYKQKKKTKENNTNR